MVDSIGGIGAFAVTQGLARQNASAQDPAKVFGKDQLKSPSAKDTFLDYMKKSPAERMEDAWLKSHGLSKEKLAAMSPQEQKAIMQQMKDDIERNLKEQAKNSGKPTVDITV